MSPYDEIPRARLEDLPQQLREEIAHFYAICKQPEGIEVTVDGRQSRDEALAVIGASRHRYRTRQP